MSIQAKAALFLLGAAVLLTGGQVQAATIVFFDDFNRADSTTLSNGWAEQVTAGDGDARIVAGALELTNDGSDATNANGRVFAWQDASTFSAWNTTLSNNTSVVTWGFNLQQVRPDPGGFNGGNYGAAFVLAGSSNDITEGVGYAVVLGEPGTTDALRLVRYSGGLDVNSNLTDLIAGGDFGDEHLSIRVVYNPKTDAWSLYAFAGGAFIDPHAVTTPIGDSVVDATHTGTALSFMGPTWNYATAANQAATFDNVFLEIPEPSMLALIAITTTAALSRRRQPLYPRE